VQRQLKSGSQNSIRKRLRIIAHFTAVNEFLLISNFCTGGEMEQL
jgi:hypothetical protein